MDMRAIQSGVSDSEISQLLDHIVDSMLVLKSGLYERDITILLRQTWNFS